MVVYVIIACQNIFSGLFLRNRIFMKLCMYLCTRVSMYVRLLPKILF